MSRLLIVDDEVDVREFAKNFFTKRKLDVETASCGEDALRMLDEQEFDLMLLDVHMGGISGVQTLKMAREKGHNLKVIMVTGVEDETVAAQAKEFGAKEYIHKPLVLEELEKVVLNELMESNS